METNTTKEAENLTKVISVADVISIAERLNMSVGVDEINEVLRRFDSEADNDPTATWELIVENCIYNLQD
jgi:hypothetical protein